MRNRPRQENPEIKFRGKDIVDLNEMLEAFQEISDHPAPVKMMPEDKKRK